MRVVDPQAAGPSVSESARRELLLASLFLAIAVGFFFDAAIGRGAFFHYDTWMQNYAFRAWWFAQLKAGHFATWCPGMFAGYPLFAETQTGPLFPTTFVLFSLLPPALAFSWNVIVMFALGGWGACTLVRRLGGSIAAGVLAGIVVQLSGFFVTHVVHFNLLTGAALVPWALAFTVGLLRGANWRDAIGLAVVVAGFALGAHPYAMLMAAFASLVFVAALARELRAGARAACAMAGAWLLGCGLGAVQLLPAADLVQRTPRGGAVDASFLTFGSFAPPQLAALANPDVFGTPVDASFFGGPDWSHYAETCAYLGILPLALAIAALVLRRDRATLACAALAVCAFVVMLGDRSIAWRVLAEIPIVQSTRLPARWVLLLTVALASLAGLGLDAMLRESSARRRWNAAAAGAAVVLAIAAFAWSLGGAARHPSAELQGGGSLWPAKLAVITESARASWMHGCAALAASLAVLGVLASRAWARGGRTMAFAACAVVLLDLATWGASFNPRIAPAALAAAPPAVAALPDASPRPRIARQGVDEMWDRWPSMPRADLFTPGWKSREATYASGAWTLPPNSQLLYGVDSAEGFTSLPPNAWLEWMGVPASPGAVPRVDLTEAQADLLSIDAVLSTGGGIAGEGWTTASLSGDVWVSRNLDPLPRARFYSSWRTMPRDELLPLIRRDDYDPRRAVLLESTPAGLPRASSDSTVLGAGSVTALTARELGPGDWSIEIPAGRSGVVVLAESHDPGWRAIDDRGTAVEIVRADGLFVGFAAAGHGGKVRVRHDPSPVRQGMAASAVSVLILVVGSVFALRGRSSLEANPFARLPVHRAAVPAVLAGGMVLVLTGLVASRGGGEAPMSPIREGTLESAAVRTWCTEAEGAYRARAWDSAAELLRNAERLSPEDASISHRLGLVERGRGNLAEARRRFERAILLDPSLDASREALHGLSAR